MSVQPVEGRITVVREFPVSLSEDGDGRTIEALIVPYNTPAEVADPPRFEPYKESWLPGCFERQTRAANRVKILMDFEHEKGLRGVVGHGVALDDREDALYGTFRVHNNLDGDKALELVREDVANGISLAALVTRSRRTADGVVERVRAHLDRVALCRMGAFEQAQVLAVRQGDPPDDEDDDEPDEPDPPVEPAQTHLNADVTERLAAIGFETIVRRAITRRPWDGAASRFDDDEWRRSCLLDRGDQFETAKQRYALPVLEPNGDLNVNGMHAAASRLNQVDASAAAKAAAARKLRRYYSMAGETPPASMMAMAGRA